MSEKSEKSKKIKLFLLQKLYKDLSLILVNLNTHINYLYDKFFINYIFN